MSSKNARGLWAAVLSATIALWAMGCGSVAGNPEGKGGGDGSKPVAVIPQDDPAPVTFSLTDAAVQAAKSVFITVDALEVSLDGDSWTSIPLKSADEVDLLKLHGGVTTPLATIATLEAGTYQQTRLRLSPSKLPRLIATDGVEHTLQVPGGQESGIKIVTPFTVTKGTAVNLTIDFDLRKSVKVVGPGSSGHAASAVSDKTRYMLKPVLRLVDNAATGSLEGTSAAAQTVCLYQAGATKDETDDCAQAVTSSPVVDGKYTLAFVPAGVYDLRAFPAGADGTFADMTGLNVASGKTTPVKGQP